MIETRPIDSIKVGDRVRQDLGDLNSLAESIDTNGGLLQPVLIKSDGTLIAGERRLAACRQLGRELIEVNVRNDFTSATALLIAERDENTCRKDFTPSEAVALGRRLEELERPAAAERQRAELKQNRSGEKPEREKGETREKVGAAVGMSGSTYRKAKQVVEAAESGDPIAEEAAAEMDATGKVEPAHRKVTGKKLPPPKPLDLSKERNRQRADKQLERLWTVVNMLAGFEEGMKDFDLAPAMAAASDEDAKEMDRMLDGSRKAIAQLRSEIKQQKGF